MRSSYTLSQPLSDRIYLDDLLWAGSTLRIRFFTAIFGEARLDVPCHRITSILALVFKLRVFTDA